MSCSYATWDAAYVLGSLSTTDRREFESHLSGCDTCSRAVRDLAGMPGLLGRLDPEIFDEGDPEPAPDTLLPRLIDAMHRGQRRRTWFTAGLAAAAAVVITVGGALVLEHDGSAAPEATPPTASATVAAPSTTVAMKPVEAQPDDRSVAFTTVGWGTRVDLTCSCPRPTAPTTPAPTPWSCTPRTAGPSGSRPGTACRAAPCSSPPDRPPQSDIRSVVVTKMDGTPSLAFLRVPFGRPLHEGVERSDLAVGKTAKSIPTGLGPQRDAEQ